MRLLLASDLHYALPQLDWVLGEAADFDAVALAGDHLDIGSMVPLESQIVVMQTYLRNLRERATTIVCSGNHDLTGRNEHDEKSAPWVEQAAAPTTIVDWQTLDLDGARVTVCPWWDGPNTRELVAEQLATDAAERPRRWIWVYHYPPDAAPVSWTGRRHIGDADLNEWIDRYQPDLVLTGHIHDSPFREGGSWLAQLGDTWVINAGHTTGPIPAHAIVDTVAGTAQWWSPYGQDTQRLWASDT